MTGRSWDVRHCPDCNRPRVHLMVNRVWRCIGRLKGATSPCDYLVKK